MSLVRLPDGRRLHVWEGGDPLGHPVVFLHGCPDCRLAAVPGSPAASALGVRLISFSRPGYGSSDPCESDHLTVADDIVALVDALGIDRFALIGMSVGGPYALACAARHPVRVTSVAMVAAPVPSARPELLPLTVDEGIEFFRPDFEQYVARVAPTDPDVLARALPLLPAPDAASLAGLPAELVAASIRESLARTGGYLRDAAVTFTRWPFSLADVTCPVHLFYGSLDPGAPPSFGHWYADNLADTHLTVLDDTGHLGALLENWDRILESVRPLLSE